MKSLSRLPAIGLLIASFRLAFTAFLFGMLFFAGCRKDATDDNADEPVLLAYPEAGNPPGAWLQFAGNPRHDTFIGGEFGGVRYIETLNEEPLFENYVNQKGGMIILDGRIFLPDDEGRVISIDAESGEIIWQSETSLRTGNSFTAGTYHRGILYYGTVSGGLIAIDAGTGGELWRMRGRRRRGGVRTSPVIDGERLYFLDLFSRFYCLDALTGGEVFVRDFSSSGRAQSDPVIISDSVIFGTPSGMLYSLGKADGNVSWVASFFLGIQSSPVVQGEMIYFACLDNGLYGVDAVSGEVAFRFDMEGGSSSTPLVFDGKIVCADDESVMYCVSLEDGEVLWQSEMPTPPMSTCLGFEDAIVVACSIYEWVNLDVPMVLGELEDYIRRKGPFVAITKEEWKRWEREAGRDGGGELHPPELSPIDTDELLRLWPDEIRVAWAERAELIVLSWEGEILERHLLPEVLQATPAVYDGKIYLLDKEGYIRVAGYGRE